MLLSFLLRHGRVFTGCKNWSRAHARWLAAQRFDHPAQQLVFQDQVDAITDAQLAELVHGAGGGGLSGAGGVSFIVAVTFVSEAGDVRRFDNPRQLMAFLGLVPSERSTGDAVKPGGLTLATIAAPAAS
ncbi:transposase [Mesorhizobium sp. M1273]|uniref:transposase n=1 Tax=Mesorhizobium sp. M1273 TaxID=2957075 RepID=UPI0033350DDB